MLSPCIRTCAHNIYKSMQVCRGVRQASSSINLSGIYPPICTPFNTDESVAWDKLEENINRWNKEDLKGYLVQGSNGEYCYLDQEERVEMIKVVKSLSPDKLVLCGSGCESTLATIEMTNAMGEAGADAAVVVTPCYFKNKMDAPALESHYRTVADASPIPVILYSVPANTGIDLPIDVIARLSHHPNIIGIKDSGGDITKIGAILAATQESQQHGFQVLAGSASFLLPALVMGAVGGICALANVLPAEVCQLEQLFRQQRWQEAKTMQYRLIEPNSAVTKSLGVPGLKKSLDWFGYYGGPCRKPLLPLTESQQTVLAEAFKQFPPSSSSSE